MTLPDPRRKGRQVHRYSLRPGAEIASARGSHFVLDVERGETYELNETALLVLKEASAGRPLSGIVAAVRAKFHDAAEDEVSRDVQELLKELLANGILVTQTPEGPTGPSSS